MTRERITMEEYRALTARKTAAKGSTSGWGGWRGPRECCVCGVRVKADESAEMRTQADGSMWCRHIGCKRPA